MKKAKLFALLAATMILSMLLASCGNSINSYYDLFSKNKDFTHSTYDSQYIALPELDGYSVKTDNDEFVVFVKRTDDGIDSHKVLSMRSKKVVATFATMSTKYDIQLVNNIPAFVVEKTSYHPDTAFVSDVEYSLYDASGNCVTTTKNDELPYEIADLIIYDYTAYTYDVNGVVYKFKDIPEYLMLDKCFAWNDAYLYVRDDYGYGYTVYDRSFNSVSYWSAPSYALREFNMFVLDGNDVLVQYSVLLDEDEDKYDFIIQGDSYINSKLDLCTFIVNAKTGEAKELKNFDYIVESVITKSSMTDASGANYCKFENIATLVPIVDKHVDSSASAVDLVIMTNKGKLKKSVKFVDYQKSMIPVQIDEDLFCVEMTTGEIAIINKSGKILNKLNKYYDKIDKYVVGDVAIYDFNLQKVYDFRENDATLMGVIDNTVFMKVNTDNGYNVVAFRGGNTNTVFSYDSTYDTGSFSLMSASRCYQIYNAASQEYSYYNSKFEHLTSSTEALNVRYTSNEHSVYLMTKTNGDTTSYSMFIYTSTAK